MIRKLQALLTIALCLAFAVHAQDEASNTLSMDDLLDNPELIKESYEGSSAMPDGTAYSIVLAGVTATERESTIKRIGIKLDLDRQEATAFYNLLLDEAAAFEKAVTAASSDLACINGTPRAYGDAAYDLLGGIDDVRQQQGDVYLARLLDQVGPKMADKVSRWIDDRKTSMTYIETDYRRMAAQTGRTGDVVLAGTCNSLATIEAQ